MKAARLLTHQRKIDRYQRLLNELRFIEQQLSEERSKLAMLQFMNQLHSSSNIWLPDGPQ
jgi:hypothetical protein